MKIAVDKIAIPTVADIRRRAMNGVQTFDSFVKGLDQFGRVLKA